MLKKSITVKINDKDYTIYEFTIKEIIDLTEGSNYFGINSTDKEEEKKKIETKASGEITSFLDDFKKTLNVCCDFDPDVLLTFSPSQIRLLYDGFKEVNKDFLDFLKALGIMENLITIKDMALDSFSKTLVTSLNQDM